MFKAMGKFILKYKWIVVIFWLTLAAIVYWKSPVLSDVSKSNQEKFLQQSAESLKASKLIEKLYPNKGNGALAIITISREKGIANEDKAYAIKMEEHLKNNLQNLKIKSIISPFSNNNLEVQMVSENKKAALVILELSVPTQSDEAIQSIRNIRKAIKPPSGLNLNITGDAAFVSDENDIVNKSMNLTTKITIGLVLIVLILIYRSPIAPIIPLVTIGLSFVISSGIVGSLTKFGFKVSSYTEMFMIAVLFGAGTDYCLLLISRFKEKAAEGISLPQAVNISLTSSGESIVSSGGTVLIGFLFMGLAKFGLFNTTGPSVAIGVAVTILMVVTLVPAFIAILGKKIFWPFHKDISISKKNNSSKIWRLIAKKVTTRPGTIILIILLVSLPFVICNKNMVRSFDQISELPITTDSVKGFQVIKQNFNVGEMLPLKIVINSNKNMWDTKCLASLEQVAGKISAVENVVKVRTATRPMGEVLNETLINNQVDLMSKGLENINLGINPLVKGLDEMKLGVSAASAGMKEGGNKTQLLVNATNQAKDGVSKVGGGLIKLKDGQDKTILGLSQIYSGLGALQNGLSKSQDGMNSVQDALTKAQKSMEELTKNYPQILSNLNFQISYGTIKNVIPSLGAVNKGLGQIQYGVKENQVGVSNVQNSLEQISLGMASSSDALNKIGTGLDKAKEGQINLANGLKTASSDLNRLSDGFIPIKSGLNTMESGISKICDFTKDYKNNGESAFYLPSSTLEQYPQLKEAMSYYISQNGKGVTLEVILSTPPYTNSSLDKVKELKTALQSALKGTELQGSEFYIGGPTSVFNDIREATLKDFINVMIFVLLGIFVVLAILLKSLTAPIYLLFTIVLSYISTMGITYLVFQVILGYEGISWAVPFFTFCVLVALGIDYNIFLMARVKEEYTYGDIRGSVERAVTTTGQIITSCGIIMAGTFGAMMAASIKSMAEVGFAAVVGLLLDTFIIRCLLVPSIAVKMGDFNWWPHNKKKNDAHFF